MVTKVFQLEVTRRPDFYVFWECPLGEGFSRRMAKQAEMALSTPREITSPSFDKKCGTIYGS